MKIRDREHAQHTLDTYCSPGVWRELVHECLLQYYLKYLKGRNKPNIYQLMNG